MVTTFGPIPLSDIENNETSRDYESSNVTIHFDPGKNATLVNGAVRSQKFNIGNIKQMKLELKKHNRFPLWKQYG